MNYINTNKKRLVGRNNQPNIEQIVIDYDTIEAINFQFINDKNQILNLDNISGLYFAGGINFNNPASTLLFLSRQYSIIDNVLTFNVDTYTSSYLAQIKKKNTPIQIEIGQDNLNNKRVYLRDSALAWPRVYIEGNPPAIIEDDYYTKVQVDSLIDQVRQEIPTKTSQLDNDTGFITGYTQTDPVFRSVSADFELKSEAFDGDYNSLTNKPLIPTKTSELTNDSEFITGYTETDPVYASQSGLFELKSQAFDGDYNSLTTKPSIPTKTSELTNDSGFITGYTQTDPVFRSVSAEFQLKSQAFDGDYNSLTNKPLIPTKTSQLDNDSGFITGYTETDPIFTATSGLFELKSEAFTNKQRILSGSIVVGTYTLEYNHEYDIFMNEITLSSNTLDIAQISFTNESLSANETATFENWFKFTNQVNAEIISIDNNISIVDDLPDILSGTQIHVFVRRIYKDSNGNIHEAISYSYSF